MKHTPTIQRIIILVALSLFCIIVYQSAFAAQYDNETASGFTGKAVSINLINQDPDPANAGNTAEVRLGIQNGGPEAMNDIEVELIPSYPFTIAPGESAVQTVGTVQGYQGQYNNNQQIIKYIILVNREATAGSYDLKVNLYQKGSAAKIQKTIALEVKGKQNAEIIHIDRTIVVPGKQSNMTFTITNVGTSPLQDITFSWYDAEDVILPVGSDNTRYVKYITVGDNATMQYQVVADTNADPGLYKLNLRLSYIDPRLGQQNISTIAGVYVGGGTDFDVAYSDSGTAQTAFSVANTGSNPAYSVSVIIPDQLGWRVTGSNSAIIGNLNKGDYTITSFALQATNATSRNNTATPSNIPAVGTGRNNANNANSARDNNNIDGTGVRRNDAQLVRVQIAYSDTTGERQVVEKFVRVSQGTAAGVTGARFGTTPAQTGIWATYKWYIIAIVLIAGVVVGYYIYKRKKQEKFSPVIKTAKK